ncbi:MAG TPA: DUF3566 domain-containing protein [Arachnia sp.]|nr:DUF3566 domain-containing protein [Arachnia sp.]HMR13354.1 DUF3566 domain-containing protein [Arachnia sp.]
MSENSPRWPGSNGAPGLDFSPYRKPADEAATVGVGAGASSGGSSAGLPVGGASLSFSGPPSGAGASAGPGAGASARSGSGLGAAESELEATQPWSAVSSAEAPVTGTPIPAPAAAEAPTEALVPARKPRPSRRTRKARLRLARIDPWSVMKTTFLFSIAFGVMMVVASFALWSVLAGSGALESLNSLINTLISSEQDGGVFKIEDYLGVQRVLGFSVVVAAIDVVIITAVATLFAFLYNLSAVVMGGLEVTLAED